MSYVQNPRVKPNPAVYSTISVENGQSADSEAIVKAFAAATGEVDSDGDATSGSTTAAALEPFYLAMKASGLYTTDECVQHLNPAATRKLVTFNVAISGTAVEADIEDIIIPYVNALGLGADVDASVMSDAILALGTVTTVDTFELSLDADPTGETTDLTIAADEIAYTTAAAITFTDND